MAWPSRSRGKEWLDAPDFPTARRTIVASNAGLVGAIGTLFFIVVLVENVLNGAPSIALAADLAYLAADVVLLGLWAMRLLPVRLANAAIVLLAFGPTTVAMYVLGVADPTLFDHNTPFLIIISMGLVLLSWRTFAVSAGVVAAFGLTTEASLGFPLGPALLESALPGVALGAAVHWFRWRSYATMFRMHREERDRAEALAESEERWRALIENAPQTIVILSREGVLEYVHRPGEAGPNAVSGKRVGDFLPPPEMERFHHLMAAVFDERRTVSFEMPVVADGTTGWRAISAGPIRRGEHVVKAILFVTDVTERRKAEEAMRQAEKLGMLGTLVAGVAHEINNPLTYLRGNLELNAMDLEEMLAHAPDEATRAALEKVLAQQARAVTGIDRIEHITRALKRVARAEGQDRKLEDVNGIIETVLTVAAPRLGEGTVTARLAATNLVMVNGVELSQTLLNLLFNAADAVKQVPHPAVVVRSMDDAHGGVVIEVEDNGTGIPQEAQSKVFTPFHTTKPEGTGLGLAISRRIVMDHGGTLTFTTAAGKGTTFRVTLPRPAVPDNVARGEERARP